MIAMQRDAVCFRATLRYSARVQGVPSLACSVNISVALAAMD